LSTQTEFDFEARKEARREATAEIIARIKKLLRLGADKRGNAHEAERAMQLAFELSEKYRVDMDALDLDEATGKLMHEYWDLGLRFDRLRRGIFSLLQTYFHVTVCVSTPRMLVIGKPTDVLIAKYVHDFLLRAGRNCLRNYEVEELKARRRLTTNKRAAYIAGFIWGLSSKLHGARDMLHLTDVQKALVIVEDAERTRHLGELVPPHHLADVKALPDRKHRDAQMAGYFDGRDTSINQPLAGSAAAPLQLCS
jgi:uncharacterized protein DUF2786